MVLVVMTLGLLAGPSWSQERELIRIQPTREPVIISADTLRYNRETAIVTATGNVQIVQGDRIIFADKLTYNQKTKTVVAEGNVSFLEPDGHTVFAKRVEFSEDLKNGIVEQMGLLFPDKARLAANGARRIDGQRMEMAKVTFSPCRLCKDNPKAPPFWQIKARRVSHDKETRDIVYRDARLEFFGVPLLYAPYFSHPDPTVRRRTGFLAPRYGQDSQLGFTLSVPYFWVIDEQSDLLIRPLLTTKEYAALFLTYRRRIKNGAITADGSYTRVKRRDSDGDALPGFRNRGHFFGKIRYDIDSNWRIGINGNWASDKTYLRRYDVSNVSVLESNAWVEGFYGRNYFGTRLFHYYDLDQNASYRETPFIFPFTEVSLYGKPDGRWGRWHFNMEAVSLQRFEGTDSRRLTLNAGWRLPYTDAAGWRLTLTGDIWTDLYLVSEYNLGPSDEFSGFTGRIYPAFKADWRYPFARELGNVRHVIEPRAAFIAMPPRLNPSKIPNEDSEDFELSDINIFDINRFPGRDRVDDGMRIAYGITNSFYGNRGGRTEIFLGQSIRITGTEYALSAAGASDRLSDIVGRVTFAPIPEINVSYRFRANLEDKEFTRHEVTAVGRYKPITITLSYLDFKDTLPDDPYPARREIRVNGSLRIDENWLLYGGLRYDMASETRGFRTFSAGTQYQNECCTASLSFQRIFYESGDIKPTTRIYFRIVLKYLGEFRTNQ